MTVFVIQAQHPEIPVARIYLGTLPFLVADFVLVALLIAMPALALWLPGLSADVSHASSGSDDRAAARPPSRVS